MKKKKIVILTSNPFPDGLAGTNRILCYCKGFIYHGYKPEVWVIRPTEPYSNCINSSTFGTYDNIKFTYPGRTTIRVASFWGRRKNDQLAKYATLRLLFKTLQKREISFIIFYGNNISVELFSIFLSRCFRIRIYKEESEHPSIYFSRRNILLSLLNKWIYINKIYRYYDGILVMTDKLRSYFLTKNIPECKIIVVPQTIDIKRFEQNTYNSTVLLPNDYIAYLGPLNQQKDGILTLVESFAKIVTIYPEMQLIIAGVGSQQEINILLSQIIRLRLNDRVHYIGRIPANDIPALFHRAKLLISCRTKSFQNDYSFPTKVIEYLASGKPVVSTAPGELSRYLKDRINSFVSNTTEPSSYSIKILEVLQDYDFALKVAQKGKELVREKFNPIKQSKRIIDFSNGQKVCAE